MAGARGRFPGRKFSMKNIISDNHFGCKKTVILALLPLLAVFLMTASISLGSSPISFGELAGILTRPGSGTLYDIVWKIRLPRTLAAMVLGGALALSGYLMQTYFRNPIAGPYVLGISSGAKLFVAIAMIVTASGGRSMSSALMIGAAFCGALLSMGFVLAMSGIMRSMSMLMVAGIMMGYICSAATELVVAFAQDAQIVSLHGWSKGSFSGMNWQGVGVMWILTLACLLASFFLSKPIGAYLCGPDYAASLGVRVGALRVVLILISSFLAACVTAYAGPVSFVGIAVPRLINLVMKDPTPAYRIPACFLGGGIFCLICDMTARWLFAPTELSVSTVTAVFGAPVVIMMLIGRAGRREA